MKAPETFLEYITRKTGLGRTGWSMVALIHVGCALYVGYTVTNYPERGWWVLLAFAVGIAAIMWGGTYGNYRLDRARASKPPNLNHYPDVCEGCVPVRMKNGGPIRSIVDWYAATRKITRDGACTRLIYMGADEREKVYKEHDAYLAKFPQP